MLQNVRIDCEKYLPKFNFFSRIILVVEGRETWELVPEYQKYYQWVIIVLIIQAVMFYTPAFLWKGWECGRIKQLCDTLGLFVKMNF